MISVVIPVYNGEKTIGRAVESVLKQEVEKEIIKILIIAKKIFL